MHTMIDVVFVGQTIPERRRKDPSIVQVCAAGYSPTMKQLVRIYPLPVCFGGHRWDKYMVPVERNKKDSRRESLKIPNDLRVGEFSDLERTHELMTFIGKERREDCLEELEKLASPSIKYLNSERRSLGIIKPRNIEGYWADNPEHTPLFERSGLFEKTRTEITKKGHARWARVRARDEDGEIDLMLNAWDVYEWHRRHSDRHPLSDVWENLQIGSEKHDHLLLVGNMSHLRRRWLVIAVLSMKRPAPVYEPQLDLFGASA